MEKKQINEQNNIKIYAKEIVKLYIESRFLIATNEINKENEDEEGDQSNRTSIFEEFYDYDQFTENLESFAYLARFNCDFTLPFLNYLFEQKINRYKQILLSCKNQIQQFNSLNNLTREMRIELNILQEQLYYLIEFSSVILADAFEGETPIIPSSIDKQSFQSKDNEDNSIILIQYLFSLITFENEIFSSTSPSSISFTLMMDLLSPLISKSLMIFLTRWSKTYLFFEEEKLGRSVQSHRLKQFFGTNEGGLQTLNFIIQTIYLRMQFYSFNSEITLSICQLLLSISSIRSVQNNIEKTGAYWPNILSIFSSVCLPSTILGTNNLNVTSFTTNFSNQSLRIFTQSIIQLTSNSPQSLHAFLTPIHVFLFYYYFLFFYDN